MESDFKEVWQDSFAFVPLGKHIVLGQMSLPILCPESGTLYDKYIAAIHAEIVYFSM